MGLRLRNILLSSCFAICLAYVIHQHLSQSSDPRVYHVTPPSLELDDRLISNDKYSKLEKIHLQYYTGPESFAFYNGSLYTTVKEGKILKINDSGITVHATLASPDCTNSNQCSRPLGLRMLKNSRYLLVTDAYLGVYSVSLEDGGVRKLFPLKDDFKFTFFDDSFLLPNGSVFITEASTNYTIQEFRSALLEGLPSGRLIMADTNTGKHSVILDNLRFPNGIEIHRDGKSILVAESMKLRILRVPLDGGEVTLFRDGLPGSPDNIRASPRGGYWVPVQGLPDSPVMAFIFKKLPVWPNIRYLLSKLMSLFPKFATDTSGPSILLRLDEEGNIAEIWKDLHHELPSVSEVLEYNDTLYTGSFYLPYIGRLKRLSN
uniref:Strictosidine synthase conserved region domain-containing protein n=1 Tax=Trichobilharzia regenti TaxID=157069 RepID=A0AA85K2B2_TRIRE|nr:unnamed protein product [Trichobilharzia regenti]